MEFGSIAKIWNSDVSAMLERINDSCYCIFPSNATSTQKTLLLCATLYIDSRYFEISPGDEKREFY